MAICVPDFDVHWSFIDLSLISPTCFLLSLHHKSVNAMFLSAVSM